MCRSSIESILTVSGGGAGPEKSLQSQPAHLSLHTSLSQPTNLSLTLGQENSRDTSCLSASSQPVCQS